MKGFDSFNGFRNSFGEINNEFIVIKSHKKTFNFSNVNFLELERKKKKFNLKSCILGLVVVGSVYYFSTLLSLLFLFLAVLWVTFFNNKRNSKFYLKIVFSEPSVVYLTVSKKELSDAKLFIRQFGRFKSIDPRFE